ncbi:MAG TPA: DUF4145 domain-containing protein [Flavobacterium sp.]|uniref:DUF4145 domain-containing protein n=1 Tax=Flavobacterium sp. TaxID=239 RepID=UPI002ED03A6B
MNKDLWHKRTFTDNNPIDYVCPKCTIGILAVKTLDSKLMPGQEEMIKYSYPYGISYVFSGILECKNKNCGEVVSISGIVLKDIQDAYEDSDGQYVEFRYHEYKPKFFYPYLAIIPIGKNVPKEVEEQLKLSFSHFFNDLSSCANRIRNSIELILDDLKAPKKYRHNNKLKGFRTLHDRILNYQNKLKNKRISNLLLAIKIIGNEGSHVGKVALEDILDAYEFLELILEYVYHKNQQNIHERALEIVQKNKPRSKR